MTARCLLRVAWPVRRPVSTRKCCRLRPSAYRVSFLSGFEVEMKWIFLADHSKNISCSLLADRRVMVTEQTGQLFSVLHAHNFTKWFSKFAHLNTRLSGELLAWLSVWSNMQLICIWSSWCHCHLIISCSSKIQNGLPFWWRLTQVVLEKILLNCSSSAVVVAAATVVL